jgi:hypothetical protein
MRGLTAIVALLLALYGTAAAPQAAGAEAWGGGGLARGGALRAFPPAVEVVA